MTSSRNFTFDILKNSWKLLISYLLHS